MWEENCEKFYCKSWIKTFLIVILNCGYSNFNSIQLFSSRKYCFKNLQSQLGISQTSSCELFPSHSLSLTGSPFADKHLRYRTLLPIPHVTLHAEKSVQQPHDAFCGTSDILWQPSTEQFLTSSLNTEIFRLEGSEIGALQE